MRLIEAIPVTAENRIVFVGAGGKSASMFRLARQVLDSFSRVIVTASTHLAVSQVDWADHYFMVTEAYQLDAIDFAGLNGLVLITGPANQEYRTEGLSFALLTELEQIASRFGIPMLIEGDGSRRRPLKAPATHEPAIPPWVNGVAVCAGMSSVGQPLDEIFVHRPELFSSLSGIPVGENITVKGLARVINAEQGGLKNIPPGAKRYMLLNQVETSEIAGKAKQLGRLLLTQFDAVVACQLKTEGEEVSAVYRQVAGVVLAAGGSERLGRPKQLLDWQGKPFVRACAETALTAGLSPVIVVTGAYEDEVAAALEGLSVEIVHNPDWPGGQGTSVRQAVKFISQLERVQAGMFLLVDQPQIPVRLIESLLEAYSYGNYPVVAPMIDQRKGNPVLFDRITFLELSKLEGDAGGRQVFSKFRKMMVPWHDSRDGLDVDTEEDYRKLVDSL